MPKKFGMSPTAVSRAHAHARVHQNAPDAAAQPPYPWQSTEPVAEDAAPAPIRFLPGGSAERKNYPVGTGVVDYFPDALAAVARISHAGNQKHNPGQPLHWARGKSMDHADCLIRHFIERGGKDADGNLHSAQLAWRALAMLQEELERDHGLSEPRGAIPPR